MILKTENLTKIYRGKKRETVAVSSLSMVFPEKGLVFINGISGSGKTTLMNMLCGIDRPTSGSIYQDEKDVTHLSQKEWDQLRNTQIGIVFQDFNLLEDMTVAENLMLPLRIQTYEEAKAQEQVLKVLEYVGLEEFKGALCGQLSAGQKQRVAIARAIIKNPQIVLADEATGNLDPENAREILRLFDRISKQCLVVLISHDWHAADEFGDRIITLSEGKVIEDKDNSKNKLLSEDTYEVEVEVQGKTEKYPLNQFDMKQQVIRKAQWNGTFYESLNGRFKVEKKDSLEDKSEETLVLGSMESRRLPGVASFKQAVYLVRHSKGKMALALILSAFLSTLFFFTVLLVNNDYSIAVSKYIQSVDEDAFEMVRKNDGSEESVPESNGKAFIEGLSTASEGNYLKQEWKLQVFAQVVNTSETDEDAGLELLEEGEDYWNAQILFADAIIPSGVIFSDGTGPQQIGEAAITKELAEKLDVKVSDAIHTAIGDLTICGLFELTDASGSEKILLSKAQVADKAGKITSVALSALDVTWAATAHDFAERVILAGSTENITEEDLTWGRMPTAENEVLISDEKAMGYGDYINDAFPVHFRLPDLYDAKYEGKYDNQINLFDRMGKKVDVVGIYVTGSETSYSEVLFVPEVFDWISDIYEEYYSFTGCLYIPNDNMMKQVQDLTENGYRINDDRCASIYSYRNMTIAVKDALYTILAVLFVMLTFILIAFLGYSVKDQSRRIGILRAIGVQSRDIRCIFLWNSVLISIVSIFLADLLTLGVFRYLNHMRTSLADNNGLHIDVFTPNVGLLIGASVVVLVICLLVTYIPLAIMSRKKTIQLLQDR
ncbi:MAG: ATP-binding cassette domain-containing protein [Lachnospiraceae bacterium]|nr:ATP-binding cassette domain-containing protein [Lachnospiraceae bacterium]